jgi:hypothetical protein
VAQATALAALGNFDFVKQVLYCCPGWRVWPSSPTDAHLPLLSQNLNFTRDNCNGIESYCLYFVLSVVDYWQATLDNVSTSYFRAYVEVRLAACAALGRGGMRGGLRYGVLIYPAHAFMPPQPKLEHAHDIWGKNANIGFYGARKSV